MIDTAERARRLERTFLRHLRGRRSRAEAASLRAKTLAERSRDPIARAVAARTSGLLDHLDGRPGRAALKLERAAALFARADALLEAGDIQRSLIDVHMLAGRYAQARNAGRTARRLYRWAGGAGAGRLGRLAMNEGNLHHRQDRHEEALRSYAAARRWFLQSSERLRLAEVDFNEANILSTLDRTDAARAGYTRAREVFREERLGALVAQADAALATLDLLEGRLDAALARLEDVRARQDAIGDKVGVAHSDLDAADALLRLNRPEEAARSAARAEATFRRAGHDVERALCFAILGGASLARGLPARARRLFERAREIQRRAANRVGAATATVGIAEAEARSGRPGVAVTLARRAAAVFRAGRLASREARALAVAAGAALAGGRERAAEELATRAASIARRCGDLRVAMAAELILGRVEQVQGRSERAFARFVRAERCVEGMRRGVTAEESRLAFAIDKSEVYEAILSNRLGANTAAATRQALRYAERGKARALAESVAAAPSGGARRGSAATARLLERLRDLDRRMALAESRVESGAPRPGVRAAGVRLDDLAARRVVTVRALARRDPERATLMGVAVQDPLATTKRLAPSDLVLEYAQSDGAFHVFAVGASGLEARRAVCTISEAQELASLVRFQLGKGALGEGHAERFAPVLAGTLRGYLERLHDLLLGPVDDLLDGRRLRIVPHGILHGLPFHAFERQGRALIDRCEVSYAPSLAVLGLLARRRGGGSEPPLVLGVPDAAAPQIEDEVAAVSGLLEGALVFRGAAATVEAVRLSERRPQLLHVACHGFYGGSGAFAGGLRLGDAWLSLDDVNALRGTADLVVLSGCETGRGTVYSGDEWVGLVRGFLQAGARAVVASLWEVHDGSAVTLMADFYRGLSDGLAVGTALARAQRDARRRDPLPLRWAPFMVVGDPDGTLAHARRAA